MAETTQTEKHKQMKKKVSVTFQNGEDMSNVMASLCHGTPRHRIYTNISISPPIDVNGHPRSNFKLIVDAVYLRNEGKSHGIVGILAGIHISTNQIRIRITKTKDVMEGTITYPG